MQYTCLLKAARAVTPGTKQVFDMVSVGTCSSGWSKQKTGVKRVERRLEGGQDEVRKDSTGRVEQPMLGAVGEGDRKSVV